MASEKRKAVRASHACDNCRQLKVKCDENTPCTGCNEKKLKCEYGDPRSMAQKTFAELFESLKQHKLQLQYVTHVLYKLADHVGYPVEALHAKDDYGSPIFGVPGGGARSSFPGNPTNSTEMEVEAQQQGALKVETQNIPRRAASQATDTQRQLAKDEEMEEPRGRPIPLGQPAAPLDHTTPASTILKWQSIRNLVQHHLASEEITDEEEYPINWEVRRGLLCLHGRGEGGDGISNSGSSPDQGSCDRSDDYSETGATSPAKCWGTIGGLTIEGAINARTLDITDTTVWNYVQSYEDNIQNMHPLIQPPELHAMVKSFLDVHRTADPSNIKHTNATGKRKRPLLDWPDTPRSVSPVASKPALVLERSIENALVLLVVALGKICCCKDKVPEAVPVRGPVAEIWDGHLLSRQVSPPSHMPMRRAALPPFAERNTDVIPGLDYFAIATDILGGQLTGATLKHVYAHILAGLYYGQLGRVVESHGHIYQAGGVIQIQLRQRLEGLSKLTTRVQETPVPESMNADNKLAYAFWTCLQLESDIIAELPLAQSGVLAWQERIPLPNQYLASRYGFNPRILSSFSAQVYIRKNLNEIHQKLYSPSREEVPQVAGLVTELLMVKYIEEALEITKCFPQEFQFGLNDPPARDILSARICAKWWEAQVITTRPFIRHILHLRETLDPQATKSAIPTSVIQNAEKGVIALIQSTRAFHGLEPGRFVITNVFGTAHAQWGNLLVLSAAYKDPILNQFISEKTLRDLLSKTISFFKLVAHSTSALFIDMRILQRLEGELFDQRGSTALPNPQSFI
ncbi:Zn(2)-C6 fungal-type DNA-binding domain protein [Coniochaeta hoffmannii]|uniref:Zn(2)-C6 fungal-type DNA-binding domain protein n=1 Tax=Coniochaeta hoffmannii TaxID=91930 RepID=A0AA38VJJ6_9PEZI|nr:Zn(2)-C6 fungal-type DNA-binding domain protein [Coniochaeta hoffmannii]